MHDRSCTCIAGEKYTHFYILMIRPILQEQQGSNFPKIKNKLRTIEARIQIQMKLKTFIEKHNTSRHYM